MNLDTITEGKVILDAGTQRKTEIRIRTFIQDAVLRTPWATAGPTTAAAGPHWRRSV